MEKYKGLLILFIFLQEINLRNLVMLKLKIALLNQGMTTK